MQIKRNNKKLTIRVENAEPDRLEKFSTIVVFNGNFKKYSEYPNITTRNEFYRFYNQHDELILAYPIYESFGQLTMDKEDEIIGYICIDKTDYENFYGCKFPEKLTREVTNRIDDEFKRELSTINDCFSGELKELYISLEHENGQTENMSIYSYKNDIQFMIERTDIMQYNPEFIKPFRKKFRENEM